MSCTACQTTDRTVAHGEDKTIKVTVYQTDDEDAETEDLTGFRLKLVIAVAGTTDAVISKDTDDDEEGIIQNQTTSRGQVWFFIKAEDWPEAGAGVYDMEVWLDANGNKERILRDTLVFDDAISVNWG